MYATIQLSPYMHVQGVVMKKDDSGRVTIRFRGRDFVGRPISAR